MSGIMAMVLGAKTAIAAAVDEFFNRVTLLLPGNGTNGAQNNTFLDSSSNNFTITRNGNTTQGTFSPFSQTGWSNYFDGTGDCLTYTVTSNKLDPGSAFTIDAWFYGSSTSSSQVLFVYGGGVQGFNSTNGIVWQLYRTSTNQIKFAWYTGGTAFSEITVTSGFVNESWNHIAVGFNGTTTRVWCNGSTTASAATTYSLPTTRNETDICGNLSAAELFTGYASNVRFVSGADLYGVSNTSITVPTAALTTTVSSGTVQLLSCGANNFDDKSTNAFALTVNGNPSVQAFSPFAPTAAYSADTNGGSGYFDGTGDYLTLPNNAALQMGTGAYTIEAWVYFNAFSSDANVIFESGNANGSIGFFVAGTASSINGGVYINKFGTGRVVETAAGLIKANTWYHLAVVRTSTGTNDTRIYINGVLSATGTDSNNWNVSTTPSVGALTGFSTYNSNGYISGLRVVKGTAVYTAAFTPPTAPPTAITNTSLLLNFTNAGIIDATGKNVLETVGNAQISTTQSKFGGASLAFDGAGDYVVFKDNQLLQLGSGDFTVEFWLYFNSLSGNQSIIDKGYIGTNAFLIQTNAGTGTLIVYANGTSVITASSASPANQWDHYALVRSATTLTLYRNGTSVGSATNSTNFNNAAVLNIGAGLNNTNSTYATYLNGYVDDLRISRYARYTANFTPPTAAFPLQ